MGALARETTKVRLGSLVTGNTYRNPAVLAKTVTAHDIVSGGRAQLGIGAGWYELEHEAFGIEFGTFTDRFEKLEEALQIIVPMLRGERPSLDGNHYRAQRAINEPAPVSTIPVMIGGSGEKKTLRLAAQYADESNLIAAAGDILRKARGAHRSLRPTGAWPLGDPRQLAALRLLAPTMEEAEDELFAYLGRRGHDMSVLDAESKASILDRFDYGDPDTAAEAFAEDLARGVDRFTINMPANGHILEGSHCSAPPWHR